MTRRTVCLNIGSKITGISKITPELLKIFAKYSGKGEAEVKKLITEAQGLNIDLEPLKTAYDRDIIAVDPVVAMQSPILREIAELSYKDLTKTFSLIQTKAVESAKQAYINTLNTAYVEVASGNYSLQESLKKACREWHGEALQARHISVRTRTAVIHIWSIALRALSGVTLSPPFINSRTKARYSL